MTVWILALMLLVIIAATGVIIYQRRQRRVTWPQPSAHVAEMPGVELDSHWEREGLGGRRYRHTQHVKPIAYPWEGSYRRIGNVLAATGNPDMPVGVDELVQFRLDPRIAGKSPLFYFGKGQSRVTMALLNANNVSGVVGDNSVRFLNAWNNADLTYTIAGHRLQESIYLRSGHPRTFSFRINEHVGFDPLTLQFGNDFRILQPVLDPPGGRPDMAMPLTWLVTQQGGHWVLSVTLPVGDWTGWTIDPTLSLQPDAADGLDTIINPAEPDTNNATHINIAIGQNDVSIWRELIKFSLTDLPDLAIISSTTFSIYATNNFSANARTFRVYRQKRAWIETQATWNNYITGSAWQTAGGFGANDCEQTDIGSRVFTATETLNEFKDFSLTPTTKAALDLGNGWLLKADTELYDAYLFASSNNTTAANRPKLVVEYTLPSQYRSLLGVGI